MGSFTCMEPSNKFGLWLRADNVIKYSKILFQINFYLIYKHPVLNFETVCLDAVASELSDSNPHRKMMSSFLKCRHCFHSIVSRLYFYKQKKKISAWSYSDMLDCVSIFHQFLISSIALSLFRVGGMYLKLIRIGLRHCP